MSLTMAGPREEAFPQLWASLPLPQSHPSCSHPLSTATGHVDILKGTSMH